MASVSVVLFAVLSLLSRGETPPDEDGYELWLRYRPLSTPPDFKQIVCPNESANDEGGAGCAELKRGLSAMIPGVALTVAKAPSVNGAIVLQYNQSAVPGLETDDWFSISQRTVEGFACTVIEGITARGAMYGAFRMLRELQLGHSLKSIIPLRSTPAGNLRIWDMWDNMDGGVERGYACVFDSKGDRSNCSAIWPMQGSVTLARARDYARILASVGINAIVLTNVNACGGGNQNALSTPTLQSSVFPVASEFASFGITPFLSVCFSSPIKVGGLSTASPLEPVVQKWWADKTDEIFREVPRWGGFMVKADSEGNPGPADYNCTQAQGANLLAAALGRHNGLCIWRAFVYGTKISREDRARQAYDTFMPLDGQFATNVVVQVKNGPIDFQVREPMSPLLGGLRNTSVVMEVQATQEYTGQGVGMCGLASMWESYLKFDTQHAADADADAHSLPASFPAGSGGQFVPTTGTGTGMSTGTGTTIADLVAGTLDPAATGVRNQRWHGMAAVSNLGAMTNWTSTAWAAANTYAFGRMAWEPELAAATVTAEWNNLTWPHVPEVQRVAQDLLSSSWLTYERYTSPLGVGLLCGTGGGCPVAATSGVPGAGTGGRGQPQTDDQHYWMCPQSRGAYTHADASGIGFDRTGGGGSNYTGQYSAAVGGQFDNLATCPEEHLLFFHHVPWNHTLKPKMEAQVPTQARAQTVIQRIITDHEQGAAEAAAYASRWRALAGLVDGQRFSAVLAKLEEQAHDARVFRDAVCAYYAKLAGVHWTPPDAPPTPPAPPTPAPPPVPPHFLLHAGQFCHVSADSDRVFVGTEALGDCASKCLSYRPLSHSGGGGSGGGGSCTCFDFNRDTSQCRLTVNYAGLKPSSNSLDAYVFTTAR